MAIDTSVPRSRRALLAGGIGGLAAVVASAIGRPLAVRAGDGDTVHVGDELTGSTVTKITIAAPFTGPAIWGRSNQNAGVVGEGSTGVRGTGTATGVGGTSTSGVGVRATSKSGRAVDAYSESYTGVFAYSGSSVGVFAASNADAEPACCGFAESDSTGVAGYSGVFPPAPPSPSKTGVYGYAAQDASARGVCGETKAGEGVRGVATTGYGVVGMSDTNVGVYGGSTSDTGVYGISSAGAGVYGLTFAAGKVATVGLAAGNGSGIQGYSGPLVGMPVPAAKTGVFGYAAQDANARGVTGQTRAGRGVNGVATTGTGVYATATTGYALRAVGRVKLDKCAGVATILATKSSVVVTPGIALTASSAVVATLMGSAGGSTTVKRVAVDTTANTFTIYLTANATANVKVAWHVFG